jgi:predicted small lipoprotein YifL
MNTTKMKTIKNIFTIIALLFAVASCKEEIKLDFPSSEKKLVVEAEISTEMDSSYVKLTMSADYYSTDPYPNVSGANVIVNGVNFPYVGNGFYKAPSPYVGVKGTEYNLTINNNGSVYTSKSFLEPMFRVDSIFQVFKPAEGFFKAGYAINYAGFDDRPKIKYTYFRLGKFDTILQRDSISQQRILFNSGQTEIGKQYNFELPFTRLQKGEESILIFRSIDKNMNDFIEAYNTQTSGAPGPFKVPPANLPTNVVGANVIGYFTCYDVVRKRYKVK